LLGGRSQARVRRIHACSDLHGTIIVVIPRGRFSDFPASDIQTRRTGLPLLMKFSREASSSRCSGVREATPSTPAVFFPWLS
jgi:hypothetical protein